MESRPDFGRLDFRKSGAFPTRDDATFANDGLSRLGTMRLLQKTSFPGFGRSVFFGSGTFQTRDASAGAKVEVSFTTDFADFTDYGCAWFMLFSQIYFWITAANAAMMKPHGV
jgi:hypothetical protein